MIVSLNYLSKVWDLKTLEQVKVIETQGGSVYSLVVSADYIIVGTYENCIFVFLLGFTFHPLQTTIDLAATIIYLNLTNLHLNIIRIPLPPPQVTLVDLELAFTTNDWTTTLTLGRGEVRGNVFPFLTFLRLNL